VSAADWGILMPAVAGLLLALATFLRGETTRVLTKSANLTAKSAYNRAGDALLTSEATSKRISAHIMGATPHPNHQIIGTSETEEKPE
jgi:hypothetical protein